MVIRRVLVVVETLIIHYNLYETSAVDPPMVMSNLKQKKIYITSLPGVRVGC